VRQIEGIYPHFEILDKNLETGALDLHDRSVSPRDRLRSIHQMVGESRYYGLTVRRIPKDHICGEYRIK